MLALALACAVAACGPARVETCDPGNCKGLCFSGHCLDPDADDDHDGLSNACEARLGLDPFDRDTDRDGVPDGDEVGPDCDHPKDSDGDGLIDAVESAIDDRDHDCLQDQWDPHNDVPDATSAQIAAARCSHQGVCGTPDGAAAISATCVDGKPVCDYSAVPGWRPTEDACDGLDNDCNGSTDEGFALAGVSVGLPCDGGGACGTGVVECGPDGTVRCSSGPGGSQDRSRPETCDGLDNDCNGLTDDGIAYDGAPVGAACDGRGECGAGKVVCRADGKPDCSTNPGMPDDQSTAETCDGLDNDCDGLTDDGVYLTGSPLDVCKAVGVCAGHPDMATLVCVQGQPACSWYAVPGYSGFREAACDGLDDDCDGRVDEDFQWDDPVAGPTAVGQPCGVGVCAGGLVVCSADGASAACSTSSRATPEVCNQLDDDCDGVADGGLYKTYGTAALEASPGVPPPRAWTALAYVPQGAYPSSVPPSLFAYGGVAATAADGSPSAGRSDFWRYDLDQHRFARITAGGPGGRAGAVLLHDPIGRRLLLVGGGVGVTDAAGPVWEYRVEEGDWAALDAHAPLVGSVGAAIDAQGGRLVVLRTDLGAGAELRVLPLDGSGASGPATVVPIPYRRDPAFASLADGMIYVSGGFDASGKPSSDLLAVSPGGDVVKVKPDQPLPSRARHALVALADGSLLMFGGLEASGAGFSVAGGMYRVWPATGHAESLQSVAPPALQMASAALAGDSVYLYSGMDADGRGFQDVLRLDSAQAQWVQDLLEVVPSARASGAMAVSPSRRAAFLLGGVAEDIAGPRLQTEVWSLSLSAGSFSRVAVKGSAPAFLQGAVAVETEVHTVAQTEVVGGVQVQVKVQVDDSAAYLHGGLDGPVGKGHEVASLWRFPVADPSMDPIPSLPGQAPSPRRLHSMAWTGQPGTFILYGGRAQDADLGDVWRLEVASVASQLSAKWTKLGAEPRPRSGHSAVWDGQRGRMLVVGGSPAGDLSAFDPVEGTWASLVQHPLLVGSGGAAFLDSDSRHILWLPPQARGDALLLRLRDDGGATATEVPMDVPAVLPGALTGFDPFGRQAILFGGATADGGTSSASWVIPEVCPE